MNFPRVTFGMLVLNGEPFTRYNLRSVYPYAHEIIIIEGAVEKASGISTPAGHSRDNTLQVIWDFKSNEDPEDKVHLVTKEGYWSEKDEMTHAIAQRTTGDYLWFLGGVDEFFKAEDIEFVLNMLQATPEITAVSFSQISFWGGLNYYSDGFYLRRYFNEYFRVFKWGPNYQALGHRPLRFADADGNDLTKIKTINISKKTNNKITMYHYSLVFPVQVREKCDYYSKATWSPLNRMQIWAEDNFFHLRNPFRVHNVYSHISWLERFEGKHPAQIELMWHDIESKKIDIEIRRTDDIEDLLNSHSYRYRRFFVKYILNAVDCVLFYGRRYASKIKRRIIGKKRT